MLCQLAAHLTSFTIFDRELEILLKFYAPVKGDFKLKKSGLARNISRNISQKKPLDWFFAGRKSA